MFGDALRKFDGPAVPEALMVTFGRIRDRLHEANERLAATTDEARRLGKAWQRLNEISAENWQLRKRVRDLELQAARHVEEAGRQTVDKEIVTELLLDELGVVEVWRTWSETRFAGTSNEFTESYRSHRVDGPVTIEIPDDVHSVPIHIEAVARDDDGSDVDVVFELESVAPRKDARGKVLHATYSVDLLD